MSVPALRFNGFSEGWQVQTLGNMVQMLSGYPFSSELFSQKGKKLVIPKNFTKGGYGNFCNEYLKFTTEECDAKYICNYGDLLILLTDLTQNCELLGKPLLIERDDGEVLLNQRIIKIECNEYLNKVFLMNFFLTENYHKIIKETATGSTVKHSSNKIISNLKITYPAILEQLKIANFLTAVDEKIRILTQKQNLLNKYKIGVMQQIFSQELRFKDEVGKDFPEWEETTLGDICKPQQWKTIAASELTEFGYPAYGANGQIGFYSNYNHEDETVAVTCRGATCGEVSLIPPKSYITGNAMSLDEINPEVNYHRYVYYALILRGFRDVISGSAQPQIVGSAIRKVEFAKPTIKEQTKIANFLTAIDDKITVTQTQLQAMKQYKQGLLQQMFV